MLSVGISSCATSSSVVEGTYARSDAKSPWSAADWLTPDDIPGYAKNTARKPVNLKFPKYKITGDCGGYPKISVKTAAGFCVGLVYDGAGVTKKIRGISSLGDNRIVFIDMGGWAEFNGKIYLAQIPIKTAPRVLIDMKSFKANDPRRGIIDRPHQIMKGPDGKYYVGAVGGIYRFNPLSSNPVQTIETVIEGVPNQGLHPLKSFVFDNEKNIILNVGSASNVCQNFTKYASSDPAKNPKNYQRHQFANCPEVESETIGQAQLRKYKRLSDGSYSKAFEIYAKGLRNSVALYWDTEKNVLIEGENGRDAVAKFAPQYADAEFPHEEINVISAGKHYGWPYCFDQNINNPEWENINCSQYEKPYLLLPAHAAPLGFLNYQGNLFPSWYKGRLLLTLHGYEMSGHRLVALLRDDKGLPTGTPQSIVYGWDADGDQGLGKPVSLAELSDGSVLISEDEPQNKILRLFYDPKLGDGRPVQEIDKALAVGQKPEDEAQQVAAWKKQLDEKLRAQKVEPFIKFQAYVIDKVCYQCHQVKGSPGVQLKQYDFVGNQQRIIEAGKAKELNEILHDNPKFPKMPPQGWDNPAEQHQAAEWIAAWVKSLGK